eukprot:SAG31_NODE_603_length_13622_cov_19.019953_5_plen_160_part_00
MVYLSADHMNSCLVQPMAPSLFWGGGFTLLQMIQVGQASPQLLARNVGFIYVYNAVRTQTARPGSAHLSAIRSFAPLSTNHTFAASEPPWAHVQLQCPMEALAERQSLLHNAASLGGLGAYAVSTGMAGIPFYDSIPFQVRSKILYYPSCSQLFPINPN